MQTKVYNTIPIKTLMEEWYTPDEIVHTIDDVLFFFSIKRMEEGNVCQRDVDIVTLLKFLKDAFEKI